VLDQIVGALRARAGHAARTTAIGATAVILLCIGLGFWTFAGWLFLLTLTSAPIAAVIMAALFTGASLLIIGILASGRSKIPPPPTPAPQPAPTIDSLIAAFITGLTAGARIRKQPPPEDPIQGQS